MLVAAGRSLLHKSTLHALTSLVRCNFVRSRPASFALNAHFPAAAAVAAQEYFVFAMREMIWSVAVAVWRRRNGAELESKSELVV
jgi:hypothetical protein